MKLLPLKMFNLINIGERAGSGVPNIFNVWEDEEWEEPEIIEKFDPDRTVLVLSFIKKVAKKSDNELIEQELIESIGSTKGKKYRKKT